MRLESPKASLDLLVIEFPRAQEHAAHNVRVSQSLELAQGSCLSACFVTLDNVLKMRQLGL